MDAMDEQSLIEGLKTGDKGRATGDGQRTAGSEGEAMAATAN